MRTIYAVAEIIFFYYTIQESKTLKVNTIFYFTNFRTLINIAKKYEKKARHFRKHITIYQYDCIPLILINNITIDHS